MWGFDDEIAFWLKLFIGELDPKKHSRKTGIKEIRDQRRLFLNEMPKTIHEKLKISLSI